MAGGGSPLRRVAAVPVAQMLNFAGPISAGAQSFIPGVGTPL